VDQQLVDYLRDQAIMITICGTQKARDSKTHGNAAAKEINNYLNVETNGVSARPSKKQSKRRASINPGSKATTARSQSSTRDKQTNGVERRRRSVSAKKENGAPPKAAENPG
jgi:hypothetical protein